MYSLLSMNIFMKYVSEIREININESAEYVEQ